jgi:hypothetical protein
MSDVRSIGFSTVVNSEDSDEIGRIKEEEDPPLPNPQTKFAGAVSESLDVAVAGGCITHEGRVDARLHDPVTARKIPERRRTENDSSNHIPSRRRTSSRGRSSPDSARARSSLAAVSASTISSSASSARKEMATGTSSSGSASTSAWRRWRSDGIL